MSDYKKTLNLPQTIFPMKASLTKNEPVMLEFWESIDAYQSMVEANQGRPDYVLHDGPPYANGHIHLGTAMNKILKDIIVKHRNMTGRQARYIPGWDCHGLPIEHKVEQELGADKARMSPLDIRRRCREYALSWLDVQRSEFRQLGVLGDWDDPYMTMTPAYETATAGELCAFMAQGSVQRNLKPIHWCCSCQTALAEAEVEYADHTSPSIYVAFPLKDQKLSDIFSKTKIKQASIVIWTTTPWTIPDNMAVAVHPDFEYVLIENDGRQFILAAELLETCATRFNWADPKILGRTPGKDLEGLVADHPFFPRKSPVVLADYVSLDTGTGCVHTAPGHGREDYETGLRYGLEVLSPLDDQGRFLATVEPLAGLNVFQSNPKVMDILKEQGALLASEKISHSYPHCWRCKKPVIFRATTQWFISMDKNDLRRNALEAIDNQVEWIPSWGRDRIHNMIEHRPDWCISRQRMWGVPIIALLCKDCGQAWFDADWVRSVVDGFATHPTGADHWFEAPLEDIIPAGLTCPKCGGTHWEKEDDILDVWFDSGTSFAAVLEGRPECRFPADLYLEGTDQHRGWFHSSLLASVGNRGTAPYRAVLTHGFVVDGQGRKMSKSVGNVVAPQEIIKKYGAEILRLWVASENYQEDVRISDEIMGRLVDAYRRIRNTFRFILGNISDFDPEGSALTGTHLLPLDRFALDLVQSRHRTIQKAYERFEFHRVFHTLHNLCVTDLSAFYLDIIKDRLYVSAPDSLERNSARTALWHIALTLLQDIAPILSFTAEELFSHMPETLRGPGQTVFTLRHDLREIFVTPEERNQWEILLQVRTEVSKAIEPLRQSKALGHSLDSHVRLFADEDLFKILGPLASDLATLFIVSRADLLPADQAPADAQASTELEGLKIIVQRASGDKCQRCWMYNEEIGTDAEHSDVCPRCAAVLRDLGSGA